jgi:hypothetical protein
MIAFSNLSWPRMAAICLLFTALTVAQPVAAQNAAASPGALDFSPSSATSQVVTILPPKNADYTLGIEGGADATRFHIKPETAGCTAPEIAASVCQLRANGSPLTLTITFSPTGSAASADLVQKDALGKSIKLVHLTGSGPRPIPTADHGALDFTPTSTAQTVKIKPAAGESYELKLNGAGANSFHIKTDTATCTADALVKGNCSMRDTDSPVTLTISFTPTGKDETAEIDTVDSGKPVVALNGSGNKQPPDVDTDRIEFDGSGQKTVKITPATNSYMLALTGDGKDDYKVRSDIYNCTDYQLTHDGCPLPAAGKNVKPITLTIYPDPKKVKQAKSASILATNVEDSDDKTALVTLGVDQPADGEFDCSAQYSDCDLRAGISVSLIGGLEQSYLTSEQDQTNGFIRLYTQKINPISENTHWSFGPWGTVRDLGAPQTADNQNIVTALSNPNGTITTSSLANIGYSVDFLIGLALDHPALGKRGQYSWGPILAFGATTPISSTTINAAYSVPGLGTQACTELQQRFTGPQAVANGYSPQLVAGPSGTLTTACLVNSNANSTGTPSAVSTLAFSGENRADFLEKWEAGVRTTYRIYTGNDQHHCDAHTTCQRGTVDYTIGQDAAITRGQMRNWVGKVDGIQPLPYSKGFLYLFGSVALRFAHNTEYPPLILQAATSPSNTPNPATFVEPLMQPNKDFYRIGVGLSLDQIFTALRPK